MTILFVKEKRTVHYRPDLNVIDPEAMVTIPNMPFLALVKLMKQSNFFQRFAISTFIKMTDAQMFTVIYLKSYNHLCKRVKYLSIFQTQKATETLWGYQDHLTSALTQLNLKSAQNIFGDNNEGFGILADV